jgi:hypothetical protein
MRIKAFCAGSMAAALFLTLAGCGGKPEVKPALTDLETKFDPTATAAQDGTAGSYVKVAVEAVRQNDYAGGVLALQSVQKMPSMTPDQLKAVHAAMRTLTDDLVARAGRGDAKAQADLAVIERSRSQ